MRIILSDGFYLDNLREFLISRGGRVTTDLYRGALTVAARGRSLDGLRRDVDG